MSWITAAEEHFAAHPVCGYTSGQSPASEPTALAALALAGAGRVEAARQAADWLAELQSDEGSVGMRVDLPTPRWPTALAVLSWLAAEDPAGRYRPRMQKAVAWAMSLFGERIEPSDENGHNTMLAAWPWVEGTHSWIEPSALHVLALKATGRHDHPRTREAVELLIDRQLPDGGCNYGNTTVLGQLLRPHVQPTGVAMLALAGEEDPSGRLERSLDYLERNLSAETTPASLGWGLLGLAAHGRRPAGADDWLAAAAGRGGVWRPEGPRLALLVLAAQGEQSPLVALPAADRTAAAP